MSTGSITAAGSITLAADDLSAFGQDPWWIVVIKALGIFVLLVLLTLFMPDNGSSHSGSFFNSWVAASRAARER